MFTHAEIWSAIDRLAKRNGTTPSGLARRAGLDPTIFNKSKRENNGRKHWPSTESISKILIATQTPCDDFMRPASQCRDLAPSVQDPAYDHADEMFRLMTAARQTTRQLLEMIRATP